jgi:large subunit ribosomal protein L1
LHICIFQYNQDTYFKEGIIKYAVITFLLYKKIIMAKKHGKKYRKAIELINTDIAYPLEDAVELLEKTNTVKFDPTVEIHFNLNLDPKHVDQMIRTTCSLPNGSGKTSKICVITDGDTKAAKDAGATIA